MRDHILGHPVPHAQLLLHEVLDFDLGDLDILVILESISNQLRIHDQLVVVEHVLNCLLDELLLLVLILFYPNEFVILLWFLLVFLYYSADNSWRDSIVLRYIFLKDMLFQVHFSYCISALW